MLRGWMVVTGACLLACAGEGTGADAQTCDGKTDVETMSLTSDKDGRVTIPVALDAGDGAFMVVTEGLEGNVSTDGALNGDGDTVVDWADWADSRETLTNAFYSDTLSAFNWPIREEDEALSAGDWTVYASTLDSEGVPTGKKDVDVTVLRRSCAGEAHSLHVTIAYAAGLESDREVSDAVEAAADRWIEIYADVGVDLTIEFTTADLRASLPEPISGDDAYETLYESIGEGVVVVVGEDIGGGQDLYGEAGGIPGAQTATSHSVVAISWLVHAGANATFSDDEIELMAETMAHESGHFIGLFHPVETGWNAWDALDDTSRCTNTSSCESALSNNLMFPYPVCGNSCIEQSAMTSGQVGVVLNNIGVR